MTWYDDKEAARSSPEPSLLFRTTPETLDEGEPTEIQSTAAGDGLLKPPPPSAAGPRDERPYTDISLSYYAMDSDVGRASFKPATIQDTSTIGSDSPVYGLDGIIPPRRSKPTPDSIVVQPPTARARAGSDMLSPIDQLIQQQSDLDKSISELRGLHNPQGTAPLAVTAKGVQVAAATRRDSTRNTIVFTPSFTTLGKPFSATSERSEFSLSNFPEPPDVASSMPRRAGPTRKEPKIDIVPIQIPPLDIRSNPGSASFFRLTGRFDSAGTQFDVTSFIGGVSGIYDVPSERVHSQTVPLSGFYGPDNSYTIGGNIPSNSQYRKASLRDVDPVKEQPAPAAVPIEKAPSPTLETRPPVTPPSSSSPTKPQGLGKATMSSSFRAQIIGPVHAAPIKPEPLAPPPAIPQNSSGTGEQRRPSLALRPFLEREIAPPLGPRLSKSSTSLSRNRGDAVPF